MVSKERLIEDFGPFMLSLLVVILLIRTGILQCIQNYNEFIIAMTTFSSVVIGFMSVLMGFLFNLNDNEKMKAILKNHSKRFKRMFLAPILTGFIVLIQGSIFLLSLKPLDEKMQQAYQLIASFATYVWVFFIIYLIASTMLVSFVMVKIIFDSESSEKAADDEQADYSALREKHSK